MDEKELYKLIRQSNGNRVKLIDGLLVELEKQVGTAQGQLLKKFVSNWVDKLDVDENGRIKNTMNNKRQLANIETVFNSFVKTDGIEIAKTLLAGISQVTDFNGEYYKLFSTKAQLAPIKTQVTTLLESWLGLKGNGWLQGNGYLSKLISDPRVLNDLRSMMMKAVVGQQGYNDLKSQLGTFIEGNPNEAGLLQKYARNFAYDTYSQIDRATAQVYADKLGMDYAIYEGGLIKTSRTFCKKHEGNVYTRDEIAAFDPKEAIPPNYNPFVDMGGYGCRHYYSWLPQAVAFMLRPDLKNAA